MSEQRNEPAAQAANHGSGQDSDQGGRRTGDRRQAQLSFPGADRRKGERRSGNERRKNERRSGLDRRSDTAD